MMLHVYETDYEFWVANDLEEAKEVVKRECGEDVDLSDLQQVDDTRKIGLRETIGAPVVYKAAKTWARENGVGFLASDEP